MLRLVIAITIVATIFVHSPERRPESLASDLLSLKEHAQSELMATAARSPLAQSVADVALRRTLSEATALPLPHRDDRAAALAHP